MCLVSVKTVLWKMDFALIVLLDLTWSLATPMVHAKVSNLSFSYKVRLVHNFVTNI